MNQSFKILEFDKIVESLKEYALTENAKKKLNELETFLITGPNTGGKTVAIKTIGLLSIMACGLNVPCEQGDFVMNNQYLCDIGDGQNITENLATFSAHITRRRFGDEYDRN